MCPGGSGTVASQREGAAALSSSRVAEFSLVSMEAPSHPAEETHVDHLYALSLPFPPRSHDHRKGRNADRPVYCESFDSAHSSPQPSNMATATLQMLHFKSHCEHLDAHMEALTSNLPLFCEGRSFNNIAYWLTLCQHISTGMYFAAPAATGPLLFTFSGLFKTISDDGILKLMKRAKL